MEKLRCAWETEGDEAKRQGIKCDKAARIDGRTSEMVQHGEDAMGNGCF